MGLADLFSDKNEKAAAEAKKWGLTTGFDNAARYFQQGRDLQTQYHDAAQRWYDPAGGAINATGLAGYNALADATGANGIEGLNRAAALFRATPGYQAGIDTGTQAIMRNASRGVGGAGLSSGNTMIDFGKFNTDYADRNYGNYRSGLAGYGNVPQQMLALGGARSGITTGLANSLENSLAQQGLLNYQTNVGQGNADAAYQLSKDQSGKNILGAIGTGLDFATKLFGAGSGGGGGFLGSLFSSGKNAG